MEEFQDVQGILIFGNKDLDLEGFLKFYVFCILVLYMFFQMFYKQLFVFQNCIILVVVKNILIYKGLDRRLLEFLFLNLYNG